MTIQCPKCYEENAYFNGYCYVCPDCGYQWNADGFEIEED